MSQRPRLPLHSRIFIGLFLGAVAGAVTQATVGTDNPDLKWWVDTILQPAGQIFLYLIFMMVVPLLFSALLLGVGELRASAKVGKVGLAALAMTLVLSGIAVLIGVGAVNVVQPAAGIPQERREALIREYSDEKAGKTNLDRAQGIADDPPMLGFIPRNPFKEINRALEGGLLPLMFFALLFGLAVAAIEPERAAPVRAFFDGIFAASLKVIDWAMSLAPYGVFALMFRTTATLGVSLLGALGVYVLLVLASLAIHFLVTYSAVLKLIAKRSPLLFMKQMKTVIMTAFATSSSNATLPTALKAATEDVGLPRRVSSFVLTIGATANQNGTALFEGITIVFLAAMFGVDLSVQQQFTVMGLAIVAGVGTAGVPGGAWPMIASVLAMFNVPAEAIGLVLGIDRILDMSRTVLNVYGDMTIAACVTRLVGAEEDALAEGFASVES
jgi:DAACS family dicarboxylate/amino acid:cation (Na+ or H+) symporter